MQTQWRSSTRGVLGLDYAVLPIIESRLGIKPKKSTFRGLRIIERTVLDLIRHG